MTVGGGSGGGTGSRISSARWTKFKDNAALAANA